MAPLIDFLPPGAQPDQVLDAVVAWTAARGISLYPAQEEALLEILGGANVIVGTPTGSGKSLIALGAHLYALSQGRRSFYTAPIKALVSEKFFDLCHELGSANVGMLTGDASVNASAPVICCTAEIVANMALREGGAAPVDQVVMDEFHFYADPDRGWAWQVPLLELHRAQFVLMSATLGDVRRFQADLSARTGRPTRAVTSATRPIPLDYAYARTPLHATIEELLAGGKAPVYVVHFTQAKAVERAQALMSTNVATRAERDAIAGAIGGFRFAPGFGQSLSRYVRHGIGVHHAGMLPRYRRLVERLAQDGHLRVICGTDTLGVGINVPIRTVLLTQLSKYDGTSSRLLSAREFHQIAGRAGRAGYDAAGSVVVQAPEHVIDNEVALAKAGDDPRKRRKVVRSKVPRGFVNWSEDTFDRLVAAPPEPLTSSFKVTHSMLLNVLDRQGDGCAALRRLLTDNHEDRKAQRAHIRRTVAIYRSLVAAGVVERLDHPDEWGRRVRVTVDLQADFALNQPLSPFLLAVLPELDRGSPTYALDVLSLVEATLDDPSPVLSSQLNKLKTDTLAKLKAEGVEYEERMAALDALEHPKPLRDLIYGCFGVYRGAHPWVADHNIAPKSVARDLYEQAMGFSEYVAHYGVARSEGLVLRYLTDAYKGLLQSVPDDAKDDEIDDLTAWLHELVRQVDSSLLDEWERLTHPEEALEEGGAGPGPAPGVEPSPPPVTANPRAFKVMVRNQAFRRVELIAHHRWSALAEAGGGDGWDAAAWEEAMAPYFAEQAGVGTGAEARSGARFQVEEGPERWLVRQVLDDPAGWREWALVLEVDLAASDAAGAPVVRPLGVERG
ncbi:MAG: DEAD/DEAH box helicase [Acidimicrobiales bacterium]